MRPARASTPPTRRDPIAGPSEVIAAAPGGAPHTSKVIRLDERTTIAGGVVVLNSDASGSGSASRVDDDPAPVVPPPAAGTTTTVPRPRRQQRPTRPSSRPKTATSSPSLLLDDEDDVFFTASSSGSQPRTGQQHRFADELGRNAYIDDEDEDDDDDYDEDEDGYDYDNPKARRRMSGVDRVHARRERRRMGVSGFRNSMHLESEVLDVQAPAEEVFHHNEGGNPPGEDNEKVPLRPSPSNVMMLAAASSSAGERVAVVQFEEASAPIRNRSHDDGQGMTQQQQQPTRQRPRPPRPLPPIPIVGLSHIRVSTEGAEYDDDQKTHVGLLFPPSTSTHNVVSLASPSSTLFSHSQGAAVTGFGVGVGPRHRTRISPALAPSDARFSVVSAEWVKVDAEALVGVDVQEQQQDGGMLSSPSPFGMSRFGSFGRKSYSEVGHGVATTAPSTTTTSNRFLFPFFSSPASEDDDHSSSLHTTAVDHRFFPFPTAAATDIGHGSPGRSSPIAAEDLVGGSGGGKRDSFLLRSKSARLPQRVSMIGSDSGHGYGDPGSPSGSPAARRKSKKAIIVRAAGEGATMSPENVVRRKASAGTVLKDRLRSSFSFKKVLGGDGEASGGGGGGFFGKGKEKERQPQQRSITPRPETPTREIFLNEDFGEATPTSKATRRKSVLVKKRPATAVPEGLERGNPKSRSTSSLGKLLRGSTETPRPSMTNEGRPENVPLPSSPSSGTVEGSPLPRRGSTSSPVSTPNSLQRRFTGRFQRRRTGGSLGSAMELGMGPHSDVGHGTGQNRVVSEAGGRRGSSSGGSGFMSGFFSSLSMTSITSSTASSNRGPPSTPKAGKLTKPNPSAANVPVSWSPSYGLGRGHSTSSSTFFRGEGPPPASILSVTAPATPDSPYAGLEDSPVVSTIPLRSTSPSPLSTATPRRSSSNLLFSTPKALRRISEVPTSDGSANGSPAPGEEEGTPTGWVKVKPRRSLSTFIPEDDVPPVPPIPAALASQFLVPAPPPVIPGRRPLPPPPPLILNPDDVHKKPPLVSLAYTGKQGYYAHEEARLQLQREIAEEEQENSASTTAHGDDLEPKNPDVSVDYPLTPRLKESILRAHLYTSPSSPTANLSKARMGSMYAFPRTESVVDEELVLFEPKRPHLPHRPSSASAKRWTLAVNQIPDDSEFLKEIDDLRKSRQEIATASRRGSFRKTVEGDVAEDDSCSDGEGNEGSDGEGVWMKARRAMLTVREMMRTETSYRNHLIRLWEEDSANPNPSTPPSFLAHLPSLISASTLLSSRLEEDPSAWGVSAAFLGAEDALEKAFTAWCGVVGQVMLELAGNTPPISTSASRTSLYNRKSSTGARDILDKEKPAPKRADTIASSMSGGSGSVIMSGKTSKKSKSTRSSSGSALLSAGSRPLSVQDVAIMPSQRVPRYVLLFKDLLEQTPVTSPSRALVERALQGAMRIAKNCDDAQQHDALTIPSP